MRSPAAAIAWEFRWRHRVGLTALAAYFAVMALIKVVVLRGERVDFRSDETFALSVVVPLTATIIYFVAVFTFGLSGDLAARQSMYPARMFALPVTTAALAGWPMLYGSAAMALLWFATRLLGAWPSGVAVPVIWPALLAASFLAWAQALTWMPYPLPGLRVVVMMLWLVTIDAVVMIALNLRASEGTMLALLAPLGPLAYLTARVAVGRARRGDVPDWRGAFARFRADVLPRPRDHFSSAARAQTWLEWRQHGWSLPALVGSVLPFELALLFLFREAPGIVFEVLVAALLTPSLMSAFVAATVRRPQTTTDSYGLTPFLAARPLTNAALIAAKLKATIRSALAAWLLVAVAVPVALRLSGTAPMVIDWMRRYVEFAGRPRAIAAALLVLLALLASTWKQLVQSLYVGMSGRSWLVKASVFAALAFLVVAPPLAQWIVSSRALIAALWNALPWIAAVLVCIKLSAAVWIAMRLRDAGVFGDGALLAAAACWDVAVFALYGVLMWLLPALLVRPYFIVLIAILAVPLVRVSAAPLALAWNRHR